MQYYIVYRYIKHVAIYIYIYIIYIYYISYSISPLIVGVTFKFLMLVLLLDGGLIRPKWNHLYGALIMCPLLPNPVIPTRWPIKDIDRGGYLPVDLSILTHRQISGVYRKAYGGDIGY